MYSLHVFLILSVFLVIVAETSPTEHERDALSINSIDDMAEYIEKALDYKYGKECLFSSCNYLENTPISCVANVQDRTNDINAVSPVLIKCAEEGACGVKLSIQPFKETNISLPGVDDKSNCYLTSNAGKIILSDIKQTANLLPMDLEYPVTGQLIFTGFTFSCSSLGQFDFKFKIYLDFTYSFTYDRLLVGKPLAFSATVGDKYAGVIYKAFQVFGKNEKLSKSIYGTLRKRLISLLSSFFEKRC